jgi:hypothetical protein
MRLALPFALLASALAGCATTPPPPPEPARITPPPPAVMGPPPPLPDVPREEGDPDIRRRYYADSRTAYARLADRHRWLQRWAREVTAPPPATPDPQPSAMEPAR